MQSPKQKCATPVHGEVCSIHLVRREMYNCFAGGKSADHVNYNSSLSLTKCLQSLIAVHGGHLVLPSAVSQIKSKL